MTLNYEQTIHDVVALGLYNKKNVSQTKKLSRILPFVVLIFLLLFNFYVRYSNGDEIFSNDLLIIMALISFFIFIRSDWFYKWWAKWQYSRKGFELWYGSRIITLSDTALLSKTISTESKYGWDAFRKFAETDEYFFLFTSKIQAIVIPKRIFLLPQEEHEVRSFIERKLAEQK